MSSLMTKKELDQRNATIEKLRVDRDELVKEMRTSRTKAEETAKFYADLVEVTKKRMADSMSQKDLEIFKLQNDLSESRAKCSDLERLLAEQSEKCATILAGQDALLEKSALFNRGELMLEFLRHGGKEWRPRSEIRMVNEICGLPADHEKFPLMTPEPSSDESIGSTPVAHGQEVDQSVKDAAEAIADIPEIPASLDKFFEDIPDLPTGSLPVLSAPADRPDSAPADNLSVLADL